MSVPQKNTVMDLKNVMSMIDHSYRALISPSHLQLTSHLEVIDETVLAN